MKKRFIIIILTILIVISIIGVILLNISKIRGNTNDVKITIGDSKMYTKKEIESASEIVLDKFKDFPAKLNELWYDEDKSKMQSDEWAKHYGADEAIILYSNFTTYPGETSILDGFNPDSDYVNWNWILVRKNKEKWKLVDWGY
ncbi:MAG: hypothetical protein J6J17_04220 [Bacilli bacterium]|nr:hypothetical protein [Bacilli bacterium]